MWRWCARRSSFQRFLDQSLVPFKVGGYRSYRNYLGRIKGYHVSCGCLWTESLQRTAARRVSFVLRGLAGPTRFESFAAGYGRAACSKWTEVATNHGGYRYVFHAVRTGGVSQQSSWWMLSSRNLKRSLCPCLCRKRTGWPRVEGEVGRAFASLIGLVLFTS